MGRRSGSRAQQAGIVVAAAETPLSFQKTLMPRTDLDQGLVTGFAAASNFGIAVLVQEEIESIAAFLVGSREEDERRWRRVSLLLDLLAIGAGVGIQRVFAPRPDEDLRRAAARTTGFWITKSAIAGFSVGALQALLAGKDGEVGSMKVVVPAAAGFAAFGEYNMRKRRATDDHATGEWSVSGPRSAGMGIGIGIGLLGLSAAEHSLASSVARGFAAVLPGTPQTWKPVGHVASLGLMVYGVKELLTRAYRQIESKAEAIEPAFDERPKTPAASGSEESLVPWESLSKQGRRFVATILQPKWIESVMGEAAAQPIRVFVGHESAPTVEDRVRLALDELERTGAFDRSLLMVISPTGTGYTNYVAVETAEYLTRGDMASVVMQYSMRPSPMSLDRVDEGRHLQRQLVRAIRERLRDVSARKRPRVVLFGESLGAWTSQDPFEHRGTDGLIEMGIDRALWIGTPFQSKWKSQVLGDVRTDTDRSLIGVFNDFGQVEQLPADRRSRLRYAMITHDNDAVAHFWLNMLVQAPPWLPKNHEARPPSVPKNQRWSSPTTFWQTFVDMKNAANVVPGEFEAKGHDYRKDLAEFVREVYDLRATDEQMEAVERALRELELKRASLIEERDAKRTQAREGEPTAKRTAPKRTAAKRTTAKRATPKRATPKRTDPDTA